MRCVTGCIEFFRESISFLYLLQTPPVRDSVLLSTNPVPSVCVVGGLDVGLDVGHAASLVDGHVDVLDVGLVASRGRGREKLYPTLVKRDMYFVTLCCNTHITFHEIRISCV